MDSVELARDGHVQKILLASSFLISSILFIAAFGKLFYPHEFLMALDISAALFEFVLIWSLVVFYRLGRIWSLSAAVFASWAGYSLFWYVVKLPCSCLGSKIPLPAGFSVALDMLFLNACLFNLYLMRVKTKEILVSTALALLMAVWGFHLARWIFEKKFLGL